MLGDEEVRWHPGTRLLSSQDLICLCSAVTECWLWSSGLWVGTCALVEHSFLLRSWEPQASVIIQ